MSIKDLPLNTSGNLTSDAKKTLSLIIEKEFANKESLYHQAMEHEKELIIEAYCKSVGYEKLKADLEKLQKKSSEALEEVSKAQDRILDCGLKIDGTPANDYEYDHKAQRQKANPKAIELHEKLSVIEKNAPSQTLKSKLISRMWLSTTIGEANEIMREILGNEIIPKTDLKAISFSPIAQK